MHTNIHIYILMINSPGSKTNMLWICCISTVKSVVKYYTRQNRTVYTCVFNAAKGLIESVTGHYLVK